jgi:hypothetical protein
MTEEGERLKRKAEMLKTEKLKVGERECAGLWVCGYVRREKFKEKS